MKLFGYLIKSVFCACLVVHMTETEAQLPSLDPWSDSSWVCVFEDDFNDASLDLSKWVRRYGVARDFDYETGKQFFVYDCLVEGAGILSVLVKDEPMQGWNWYHNRVDDFNYKAGEINSLLKYGYGAYEIICIVPELPNSKGILSAFWLHGVGPCNENEIDVFEFTENNFNLWLTTTHYHENPNGCSHDFDFSTFGQTDQPIASEHNVILNHSWHSFMAVWTDFYTVFYFDYVPYAYILHYYPVVQGNYPVYPMNIIAGTGVYNQDANSPIIRSYAPDQTTVFPAIFYIDHISYYAKADCELDKVFNSKQQLYPSYFNRDNVPYDLKNYHHVVTGKNILLDTEQNSKDIGFPDIEFRNEEILDLRASESILIKGNFLAEAGSKILMKTIGNCNLTGKTPDYQSEKLVKEENNAEDSLRKSKMTPEEKHVLFPNPNSGRFSVNRPFGFHGNDVSLKIYNCEGNLIYTKTDCASTVIEVDISEQASGIYFLLLINDMSGNVYSGKFIMNHDLKN
jgi:hypothetical protein